MSSNANLTRGRDGQETAPTLGSEVVRWHTASREDALLHRHAECAEAAERLQLPRAGAPRAARVRTRVQLRLRVTSFDVGRCRGEPWCGSHDAPETLIPC